MTCPNVSAPLKRNPRKLSLLAGRVNPNGYLSPDSPRVRDTRGEILGIYSGRRTIGVGWAQASETKVGTPGAGGDNTRNRRVSPIAKGKWGGGQKW